MLRLGHKRLRAWTVSIRFVKQVYQITDLFPKEELYGLTSQVKRAVISIPANIAEGAARDSKNEQRRFFEVARSSLVELDTHLEIAVRLGFLTKSDFQKLGETSQELFAMISGLIKKNK